jgi:hypothetical protein
VKAVVGKIVVAEAVGDHKHERHSARTRRAGNSTRRRSKRNEKPSKSATVTDKSRSKEPTGLWLANALLLVREHPDWSDAAIARAVGKSKSTLSRNKIYRAAAKLARDKGGPPKGFVTTAADSRRSDVEAIAPTSHDVLNHSDVGQPVPGSKCVREYCANCEEPIKVGPDVVGKNPLCHRCQEE